MTTKYNNAMTAVVAAAMICLSGTAMAEPPLGGFFEEDCTLALSGSGSSAHDFGSSIASIELDLAWFLTDVTAVALRQGFGYAKNMGSGNWNASTRVAFDYFFPIDQCYPFVGAGIGYLYGDNVTDTFFAGPEIGVRHFINETTFVNFLVEYQFLFERGSKAGQQFDDARFVYTLGLGVRL